MRISDWSSDVCSSDLADWKRYVRGDRGVFTRALLRARQSSIVPKVSEKLKGSDNMRRYVLRYIDQFEKMLADCRESDPEKLLHSTFMTADVMKVECSS